MEWFVPVDWEGMFVPSKSLVEIFLRGSAVYLALLFMLRLAMRRQAGDLGMSDILVLVLVADAAQNAMAGDYKSITEGMVLVMTLLFWDYLLDWLGFHSILIKRATHPSPLPLIRNGRMIARNMKKELITRDDLMSRLREEGIEHISQVKKACVEGSGKISIVCKDKK